MPRISRRVVVGYPHHITQRGNNRAQVFFDDQDRLTYLNQLEHYTQKYHVEIWAYCLMDNHVHLLAVPHEPKSLSNGIGLTNQTYTQHVNRKYQRSGRVWQSRFFSSVVATDSYLWSVARYVDNNPVAAGLVDVAEEFEWSSARQHVLRQPDPLLQSAHWLRLEDRQAYRDFLRVDDKRMNTMISQATRSGRSI